MLNRLLYISGLLCLLIAQGVHAQQLKVVAETGSFTDYEFNNEELHVMSPYGITVPVSGNTPRYQILEQVVSTLDSTINEKKARVLVLSDLSSPLIEASAPGNFRGEKVSQISINITRYGENSMLMLRKLKLRVYKNGDTYTNSVRDKRSKMVQSAEFETGTWYKIPIRHNSIYELDDDYLEELGIEISAIDPQNIQLWGTGGYQLPETAGAPRPQLTQIPIRVQGENDGTFNTNDRVLFYANSPHQVLRDGADFTHQLHPYSNENYVFLTIGNEPGLRLSPANNNINDFSRAITTFTDFIWKEEELNTVEEKIKSGRQWLGQRFPSSSNNVWRNIFSDTLAGIQQNETLEISGRFVSRSTQTAIFDVRINEAITISDTVPRISQYNSSTGYAGRASSFSTTVTPTISNGIIEIDARYTHNESNSNGYFDWLRITANRELRAENGRLFFYSPADGSPTEDVRYQLTGFNTQPVVMDVTEGTNPKLLSVSGSGNTYNLNYKSGNDLRIIAQSNFRKPPAGELIAPQNIRGISGYPDYVIITSEEFLDYAEELASYRANNDGMNPVIVTQQQILNEFSGGVLDPSAVRDYIKFLYDRALNNGQEPPENVLLFGDTTFDYKGHIEDSFTNFVVTYQSEESLHRVETYGTDDFFAFLDDGEGSLGSGRTDDSHEIDIGLGRIPAQNRSEAATAVQKIKIYEDPANTGDWQNLFTFAADDDFPVKSDEDLHVINADGTAEMMNYIEPGLRIKKIYEFSYPEEITGSGRRIPEASKDFMSSINNGTLVMNYSGHGNEQTLSDEELFTSRDIPKLTNKNRLPVFVTATCQFGRYDDINAQSGAEQLFFAENGGVVASFTTTRVVVTNSFIRPGNNYGLNVALSQSMVSRNSDGSPIRLGQIYQRLKNFSISGTRIVTFRNSKKFILIGDPALKFRLPENQAEITQINDFSELQEDTTLTIRALDQVTLSGQISKDTLGNPLTNFNGEAVITVMDAKRNVALPTDRTWVNEDDCYLTNCNYSVETDVLFKGKASVENGQFTSTFIVPKDIRFSEQNGRIILFANAGGQTAGGSFTKVNFNGINEEAEQNNDGTGPDMDIYLNDERFVNGSLVGSSPNLIIQLEDTSGINTTGTGVGHEIIATIDTKPQQSFVLNDFYEGSLNDFTQGRIEYPLDQIPEGSYTLKVRAWDVHNNPSEEEIFFEVASGEELSVRNVYNFPNPMNNATRFTFEHNQPGNQLDVSVRIYTLSGKPVQQIKQSLITTSSYASISWDGRDRDYDRLGNGTYIYVLRVATDTPEGRQATEQIEKLVIIR